MNTLYINVWNCQADIVVEATLGNTSTTASVEHNVEDAALIAAVEAFGGAINMSGLYPLPAKLARRLRAVDVAAAHNSALASLHESAHKADERRIHEARQETDSLRAAVRAVHQNPRWLEAARAWNGIYSGGGSFLELGSVQALNDYRRNYAEQFADVGVRLEDGILGGNGLVMPDELVAVFQNRQLFE